MTKKDLAEWRLLRDTARKIEDPEKRAQALQDVYDHRDDMMLTCIQHQADRVKEGLENDKVLSKKLDDVETRVTKIEDDVGPAKKATAEFNAMKERGKGAAWALKVFIGVASVVGYETAVAVVKALHAAMSASAQ